MSEYQTIYSRLRKSGLSKAGALGLMGNWDCESNCEACRLQGDFSSERVKSKQYAQYVNSGAISKISFMKDAQGWGLAQWTYFTRKEDLYDFTRKMGVGIESVEGQIKFALHELQTGYGGLLSFLKSTDDLYTAVSRVCKEYERPAVNNIDARYVSAQRIGNLVSDMAYVADSVASAVSNTIVSQVAPQSKKDEDGIDIPQTWPPRTIDTNCEGWPEIKLAQAALMCHGYTVLVDGIFAESLTFKVKAFQAEHDLIADGCIGPMTWKKLLAL